MLYYKEYNKNALGAGVEIYQFDKAFMVAIETFCVLRLACECDVLLHAFNINDKHVYITQKSM